jgi:predicted glycosyltransferase
MPEAGRLPDPSPHRRIDETVWIDLLSAPDVLFFEGLLEQLDTSSVELTLREKGRTGPLAETVGFEYSAIGKDFDNRLLRKLGIPLRALQLAQAPPSDVSISLRNVMCVLASKARNIPSIHFTDNDAAAHTDGLRVERLYNRFEAMATYNLVPEAFTTEALTSVGADPDSIYTYDGCKENLYVANFEPEPGFTEQLPFEEYVVVRPEALTAAYVDATDSIVPDLLARMVDREINVVYLPRGRGDERYARPYSNDRVFVPPDPMHGLQLAWHARCVLTGSGTMAREAACMGKPAVSYFPSTLLSIDQELVTEDRLFHSRDPAAIVDYISSLTAVDVRPDLGRAEATRAEVLTVLTELIESVDGVSERSTSSRSSLTPDR